jgi:hypothetical protein
VRHEVACKEWVKDWLKTSQDWLLLLDNADDLNLVQTFLPTRFAGHLLLTTRAQIIGKLARRLEVDTLDAQVGALLLLRRAGLVEPDAPFGVASPSDRSMALALTEELGGLPLALDQAGAYIEETQCGLANYQQQYQTRRAELLAHRGMLVDDHPLPVATIWSVSFQRVGERNPGAAELLRLLAWLPPDDVAEEILPAGAAFLGPVLAPIAGNGMMLNQAIEALRAYSLVCPPLSRDPH